jgi:ribose 5-phosphate isomerase
MMLIKPWPEAKKQMSQLGCHHWDVSRLFELSKNLPVMNIPLEHMHMHYKYVELTLRELAGHMVAVQNADLRYPIILDEDGEIMDGRHRLIKAIIEGKKTIKAVRFLENPAPCRIED